MVECKINQRSLGKTHKKRYPPYLTCFNLKTMRIFHSNNKLFTLPFRSQPF